ncbi:hypothetical protein [Nocardia uniformis]|nr:hypothetical protein [Nocardia uniformis]
MDEPAEVTSAAEKFSTAVHTAVGSAQGSTDALRLETRPESDLDHAMSGQLEWIRDTFTAAAQASTGRADDVLVDAVFGVTELDAADLAGGTRIRNEDA